MKTLFHYCTASTFASIISRKSIWLSSLSLSNDTTEGRLVKKTFERLLDRSKVGEDEMESIRNALIFAEDMFDGLGFCLSEKPDLLSQWRGYSDDGQGFSIGFSRDYLKELSLDKEKGKNSFSLKQVIYKPEQHEAALEPLYEEIRDLIDS